MAHRAQSDVIGVILLTAVIVILSVLVGVVTLGTVDTTDNPAANLGVDVNGTELTISHLGGTSFARGDISIVLRDGSTQRLTLTSFTGGDGGDSFSPGEQLFYTHGLTDSVRVLVVHDPSNTVLYDEAFDLPDSGGPLVWASAGDWDRAVSEGGVVHADFGDHSADRIDLGTPATDDALIAYWPLDDPTDPIANAAGNDRDLTVTGDPALDRPGLLNTSAVQFDGTTDQLEDQNADEYLNGRSAVTISVWVRSNVTGTDHGILTTAAPDDTDDYLGLRYDEDGWAGGGDDLIKGAVSVDGRVVQFESSSNVQTTDWQHVVLTWESGERPRLYLNGSEDGLSYLGDGDGNENAYDSGFPTGTTSAVTQLLVGQGTKDDRWDGSIEELRVYDQQLTATEVARLYNGTSPAASEVWQGNLTSGVKRFERNVDPSNLSLTDVEATIPTGTTVTVTVESDPGDNGSFTQSDVISLDGSDSYDVTGLSTPSRHYRLVVTLATDSLTTGPRFGGGTLEGD
ncbi:LamG-like jellyroll fold domain-containing protein [Halorhabdus sp. CUG00001]|uniref:LamG-like jellyroll fold domain-containing protein n=1 Tax=Halorhabdus sp. CUG00001 TaxID=2600297 RepID=UPI00131B9C82|nr:LamG-like jellyroll fold domain-containing protein [Halorhabdus sp. CUG00001]